MERVVIEGLKQIQQLAYSLRENTNLPKREVRLAQTIRKIAETQLASFEAEKGKQKKSAKNN